MKVELQLQKEHILNELQSLILLERQEYCEIGGLIMETKDYVEMRRAELLARLNDINSELGLYKK